MMEHEMARNLLQQEPGRGNRFAEAAGTPNIAQDRKPRHKRASLYRVIPSAMKALQISKLQRAFGLSAQQAALLAALAYGEGDKA